MNKLNLRHSFGGFSGAFGYRPGTWWGELTDIFIEVKCLGVSRRRMITKRIVPIDFYSVDFEDPVSISYQTPNRWLNSK